ncbi:MAG: 2,3-cyclic 3-phosphodiesterase [Thermoleophilaceae bacterium]|nr:2,3-cyclic 3-phosphodiesterase [Thermoleophilaceae bacterium]
MALELPVRVRERLASWRSSAMGDRDDLRPVPADALHVTLAFLGSRPVSELPVVAAAVSSAVAGLPAARLRVAGVRPVPPRRPRLFAFDLADADGAAGAVQAAVSSALAEAGLYEPERRPFWPHVTFARVRGRDGPRVEPLPTAPPDAVFTARQVTLYRSWLSPRGARYEPLERFSLSPRS